MFITKLVPSLLVLNLGYVRVRRCLVVGTERMNQFGPISAPLYNLDDRCLPPVDEITTYYNYAMFLKRVYHPVINALIFISIVCLSVCLSLSVFRWMMGVGWGAR